MSKRKKKLPEMMTRREQLFEPHLPGWFPKARFDLIDVGDVQMVACPQCGHREAVEECEILGADEGCVFCNKCDTEMDVSSERFRKSR